MRVVSCGVWGRRCVAHRAVFLQDARHSLHQHGEKKARIPIEGEREAGGYVTSPPQGKGVLTNGRQLSSVLLTPCTAPDGAHRPVHDRS